MINSIADPLMPNGISGDMRIFRIERGFIFSKHFPHVVEATADSAANACRRRAADIRADSCGFSRQLIRNYLLQSATLVICRKVYESAILIPDIKNPRIIRYIRIYPLPTAR